MPGQEDKMITSSANPKVKQVALWQAKGKERRRAGVFLTEGFKMFEEAPEERLREVYLTSEALEKVSETPGMKEKLMRAGYEEVTPEVFRKMSDTQTPQGVLFLAQMPDTTPPERLEGDRWLVLDGLQDPGNVGTIWRTADALGADGLILTNRCADPFSPKTVRSTMGACFRLPLYEVEAEELPELLERSGLPLYATALREDTVDIKTAQLSRCAVVIGSEGRGVSPELLRLSEKTIKIPMRERCESLNAAAAAAVVLWEMGR